MRIFISSVRAGLEHERDSLRGLLVASGHQPVLFEDLTALPEPSREVCMRGVQSSDAYLMLLGERYGHPMPDTGISPTAEEHVAARIAGVPRLVMRKTGVNPEPRQQELINEIGTYPDGLFWDEFTDTPDLLIKTIAAVNNLAARPGNLTYSALEAPVPVAWRLEWPQPQQGRGDGPVLEIHALPIPSDQPLPSRVLRDQPGRLAAELRTVGGVGHAASITTGLDQTAAWATVEETDRGRYDEIRPGGVAGARISSTGQTSAWARLPRLSVSSYINQQDLTDRIGTLLLIAGAAIPSQGDEVALAVGLAPLFGVGEGPQSRLGAGGSHSLGGLNRAALAVPPDEAASRNALSTAARDAAGILAEALLAAFRSGEASSY
jgi:hypothetical protein